MDGQPIEMAPWQWWANFGVLGVLAFISITAALWWLREWWSVRKPFLLAKQERELAEGGKTAQQLEALSNQLIALQVKVDTMWVFHLRRGAAETVAKGMGEMNSPIKINEKARQLFDGFRDTLRQFHAQQETELSDAELALLIEKEYGDQLLKEICIPGEISYGACLLIATVIAKDNETFNVN